MLIVKKTVIDQVEVRRDTGIMQIRFALLLVEDGVEIDSRWHRTSLNPGQSIDAQLDLVDANLAMLGKAPIERAGFLSEIKQIIPIVQTPTKIAAYQEQEATKTGVTPIGTKPK